MEKKIIVSLSFYPFSKIFLEKILEKLNFFDYELFYFDNINDYRKYIKEIDDFLSNYKGDKIIFISFGVMSVPAIQLLVEHKKIIEKAIFIEPDLSGILKNYTFKKGLFGYNNVDLVDIFIKDISISKKILSNNKKLFSNLKMELFLNFLKESTIYSSNSKLIDLINTNIPCVFLWNKMFIESWPLPQILTEDFDIKVFQIQKNIYNFVMENGKFDIEKN